jgi:Holliday junction resolvase
MSSNCRSDAMQEEILERVAQRYRDEGYHVIVRPSADQIPPFIAGFQPDLVAIRGNEGVVVEIKVNRIDLSSDHQIAGLAEIVNARPGWRLDLVVLEPETTIQKAAQEAAEPSDEQLAQILKTADELSEKGYSPYACVVAWGGLEAAMRRLQSDAELYGRTTPTELMRTLYGNGFLSREQFERLRESYKIRSQVVHGLVPGQVDPDLVRYVTTTARYLVSGEEASMTSN